MWNNGVDTKKKQNRLHVTFRDNQEETELYNFVIEQAKIGGVANYFKLLAYNDKKQKEKEGN